MESRRIFRLLFHLQGKTKPKNASALHRLEAQGMFRKFGGIYKNKKDSIWDFAMGLLLLWVLSCFFFEPSLSSGSVLRFSPQILYPWSLHPEQNGRCKGLEGSVPAEPEAVPTAEADRESTVASLSDKLRSSAPRERKLAVNTPGKSWLQLQDIWDIWNFFHDISEVKARYLGRILGSSGNIFRWLYLIFVAKPTRMPRTL